MSRRVRLVILFTAALLAVASPAVAVIMRGDAGSAAFSDGQRMQAVVRAARLDLVVGERTVPISAGALAPGDLVVGAIELVNDGGTELRYTLRVEAELDGVLHDAVTLHAIVVDAADSCPTRGAWKSGIVDGSIEISGTAWQAGAIAVFGDPKPGQDPGDRRLGSAEREQVCLALVAALDTPQEAAGRGSQLVFVAVAEQAVDFEQREGA